jgi:di/tricarboxylate transporter
LDIDGTYQRRVGKRRSSGLFLLAIFNSASCTFLTPIAHQSNTKGPGGYNFRDYWRMGSLLEIIVAIIAVLLILIFSHLWNAKENN